DRAVTESPQLLDDHAHPFPLSHEPLELASLSLAVGDEVEPRRRDAAPHRLMLELLRVRLADLLGCAVSDVVAAREEAAADWPSYVRLLMSDAGISGMLLD